MGECFFWYHPTQVVLDKGLLNGCVHVCESEGQVLLWHVYTQHKMQPIVTDVLWSVRLPG